MQQAYTNTRDANDAPKLLYSFPFFRRSSFVGAAIFSWRVHSGQNWNRQNPLDRSSDRHCQPSSPQHKCAHTENSCMFVWMKLSLPTDMYREREWRKVTFFVDLWMLNRVLFFLLAFSLSSTLYPLRKYLCEHATLNLSIASDIRHIHTFTRAFAALCNERTERARHSWMRDCAWI